MRCLMWEVGMNPHGSSLAHLPVVELGVWVGGEGAAWLPWLVLVSS